MNILMLNWRDSKNPKSGGAEIATMEHVKAWVEAGHHVTWFSSSFSTSPKEETINGVDVVRRGNSLTVYLLAPFFYLFSGKKFDIVIDQMHGASFLTPLYVRKPKIVFIHEVAEEIWDYMLPSPLNMIGKLVESFCLKLYPNTLFWVPSESTIEDLEKKGIKKENCRVILCGNSSEPLKSLPTKNTVPTFIFVSRIVKMKGVEEVIKAFSFISKSVPKSQLWIVGEGEKSYLEKLKNNMPRSVRKNIKFFGFVSEARKLYLMKKSSLILHASVKEGWGMVIIEAASQATPSVVYDVAGLRESSRDNITGIVVGANNPQALASEALKLLGDKEKYKKLQLNSLKWAKSLTWNKATNKSIALLKGVVG